jgi:oxygen-dependent protoporphyrinogen oxidase
MVEPISQPALEPSHRLHDCLIIGAGISGLGVAARLAMQGKDVLVLEKAACVGGTMTSVHEHGYLIDCGPTTILHTTSLIDELIHYADLDQEVCFAGKENSRGRFVMRDGAMHALPMSPGAFLTTRLFSVKAKLRLLQEPFIAASAKEESIAEFTQRRLGKEFLDYAINPFVSGVYAGDPARLSVRWAFPKIHALEQNYGSLIKGAIKGRRPRQERQQRTGERRRDTAKIFSFVHGIGSLPEGIAAKLGQRVALGCDIKHLARVAHGYVAEYQQSAGLRRAQARCVVLSIPAYELEAYMRMCNPDTVGRLADLEYAPVVQVFLGFRRERVGHPLNGFGVLIPHRERRRILGALWNSSLFPSRAPAGHVAFTCFLGGMLRPDLVELDADRLLAISLDELTPLLALDGKPDFVRIKKWPRAIPQYNLDYARYVRIMETFEDHTPGAFLCGNFRGGVAVGDCVMQSARTVERVQAFLDTMETC